MNAMEMREKAREIKRKRYFGKRYWYNTPQDGRVEIGVLPGLGGIWIVGYVTESLSHRRIKTQRLQPCAAPEPLQFLLDQWAHERQLPGVE